MAISDRKPETPGRATAASRSPSRDKRAYIRTHHPEDTHFSVNRRLFEGTILNASPGGTYIRTQGDFLVGQNIIVAGTFEEGEKEEKRYGKVVRRDKNGIGVQFVDRRHYYPR